jgi:hypothetical protein
MAEPRATQEQIDADHLFDGEPDEMDADEEFLMYDCGMTADGYCTKAGSEECDWVCPRGRM